MGLASGAGAVGLGVVAAAVPTYLFLSLAGRALGAQAFGPVSSLWAMVFIVGPGLFLPVQQELGRVIARQRQHRAGGHAVRRVAALAVTMTVVSVGITLSARAWLAERLFGGQTELVWCFAGAVLSYTVMFLARGVFSGLGDYRDVARLIAVESISRLALGAMLAAAGEPTPLDFGVAIALAPLVSAVVVTRLGQRLRLPPGTPVAWRSTAAGIGWLVVASLLSQLLANAGPLVVQLLAGAEQTTEAGRFLSALVLARLGLYLFQAVQATLLPNLAELLAAGEADKVHRGLRDLVLVCAALIVVSTSGAAVLGGWAVALLFGPTFAVSDATMAMLTGASGVYVLAAALTQAAIAAAGHRLTAIAWFVGCVGFAAGTVLSEDLFFRAELGYLIGSCVTAAVLLVMVKVSLKDTVAAPGS
jgi:O-antigen/teichoic acid export membrane protein